MLPLYTAGLSPAWDMPVALWHAPDGFDATSQPYNHPNHTLTVQITRAPVQRVRSSGAVVESGFHGREALCLQAANVNHRFVCSENVRFGHLYFAPQFASRVATDVFSRSSDGSDLFRTDRTLIEDRDLHRIADGYLRRALDRRDAPTAMEMDALATLLMLRLVRSHSVLAPRLARGLSRGGLAPRHLRQVTEYMEAHLSSEVSLAELANLTGLSSYHLCRAFRESTGMPPHRWHIAQRVERAREMLESSEFSVTEIAAAVGYDDAGRLASVFRKAHGVSPTQYRRQRLS